MYSMFGHLRAKVCSILRQGGPSLLELPGREGFLHLSKSSSKCIRCKTVCVSAVAWHPGLATEGVTPLFFAEKPDDLFLLIAVTITIPFYCFHSGVTVTPPGCHPTPFLPVRPRFSTILCKFAHNFFSFGCHPRGGCHPGRSASPSDATTSVYSFEMLSEMRHERFVTASVAWDTRIDECELRCGLWFVPIFHASSTSLTFRSNPTISSALVRRSAWTIDWSPVPSSF